MIMVATRTHSEGDNLKNTHEGDYYLYKNINVSLLNRGTIYENTY